MDQKRVSVHGVVECMETAFQRLLEPQGHPLSTSRVREPRGIHCKATRWWTVPGKELVHSVKESSVDPPQGLVERGVAWSPVKTECVKERGIEVDICNKVTVPKSRVELESEKDKESGKWKLDWSATSGFDVRHRIAKSHKLFEEEVIPASFGRVIRFVLIHESCDVVIPPLNSCIIPQGLMNDKNDMGYQ